LRFEIPIYFFNERRYERRSTWIEVI